MTLKKYRLLAATMPASVEVLQPIYDAHFEVRAVVTMADALAALDDAPDLISCNIHFAEGALFELLRAAKAHPRACTIPFLVIDATVEGTSPAISQSIDIASRTLGADEVIHVAQWRAQLGDEAAFRKVMVRALEHVTNAAGVRRQQGQIP